MEGIIAAESLKRNDIRIKCIKKFAEIQLSMDKAMAEFMRQDAGDGTPKKTKCRQCLFFTDTELCSICGYSQCGRCDMAQFMAIGMRYNEEKFEVDSKEAIHLQRRFGHGTEQYRDLGLMRAVEFGCPVCDAPLCTYCSDFATHRCKRKRE